jgi:hypothetical protein
MNKLIFLSDKEGSIVSLSNIKENGCSSDLKIV